MKIHLTLFLLLVTSITYSQNLKPIAKEINDRKIRQAVFSNSELFKISNINTEREAKISAIVKNGIILNFNKKNAEKVISERPENINLLIPLNQIQSIELELYQSNIFSPDFSIITASQQNFPYSYNMGMHYWGIIKGDNNSIAAISIFDNEIMGIISSSHGNYIIGKLKNDSNETHIFFNDKDLKVANETQCFTSNSSEVGIEKKTPNSLPSMSNCIRLYWEVNYDIFLDKGGMTNTTNYVTGLFNESAIIYANDNIPVSLSQVFVWDIASPYNAISSSGLLGQFQSYRNSFNGDLGHLLGYDGGGGIAAGFSGLCASNLNGSQCYSGISPSYQAVPVYSWSVEVVTHEQGHLMGSRHTHACVWNGNNTAIDGCAPMAGYGYEGNCSGAPIPSSGGTIMSYCHLVSAGINFSNGFGSQPAAVILNNFTNASCLSNCSGSGCFAPTNLTSSNVTTTTAILNWDSVPGALGYNIQYRIAGNVSWIPTSSLTNSYNASGLLPGNTYEWEIQTVCNSGNSVFSYPATFITIPLTCNAPTNLLTTGISSASATFQWDAVGGAISYSVEYREVGTTPWFSGITSTNSYTSIGLSPSTQYEWHVKTNCAGGGISTNSVNSVFVTSPPALPVACYPFSGNANDASGNNHNGTVIGPVLTTDRFGNPNSAYSFDGLNDYISLGNYSNIIPSGDNFSLSTWIQADQLTIQTILMINPDDFNDRFNASAYYSHNGLCSTFWDYGDATNGGRLQILGTTFNYDWEHYVFIINSSQNYMEVYINGVLQLHQNSSSTLVNRMRELRIGGAIDVAGAEFFFDGKIDDMAIYDQVLSQQEIQTLFAQQILCLNSVGINETNTENNFALYPTLSKSGLLHLNTGSIRSEFICKVYNCIGAQLMSRNFFSTNKIVDLDFSNLSKGFYLLEVRTGNDCKNFKFLIE